MKLDFHKMDIGSFPFNFVRTLMVAGTGGAEINECLLAAERIKDNHEESWVREWVVIAEKVAQTAEQAMQSGQTITARQAYLRASNYYRTAMFSLPPTDERLFQYLTLSRDSFHQAAKLFSPQIEVVDIPFGDARLPGYFLSAGQSKRPTLIALNGGDSTNEELVHWIFSTLPLTCFTTILLLSVGGFPIPHDLFAPVVRTIHHCGDHVIFRLLYYNIPFPTTTGIV